MLVRDETRSRVSLLGYARWPMVASVLVLTSCAPDGSSQNGSSPSCCSSSPQYVQGPMGSATRVVFLHHSTGGIIFGDGDVAGWFDDYNAGNATEYTIDEVAYPDAPYPWKNYPYDYWHLWVEDGGQAAAEGVPTLEELTRDYDVVVFKHCFPVSGIQPETQNPDIASEAKTLENYKLQYEAIKERLHQFPDKRFLVWTGAALVEQASSPEEGARAREFFTWVKQEWDEPGDNIFVWDFFELETEGGNFLLESYSRGGGDSHPNAAFAAVVGPLFAQRTVDVIEGRGDTGSLDGGGVIGGGRRASPWGEAVAWRSTS